MIFWWTAGPVGFPGMSLMKIQKFMFAIHRSTQPIHEKCKQLTFLWAVICRIKTYRKMSVKPEEGGTTVAEVSLKKPIWYDFFDVIREMHTSQSFSVYSRTHKRAIEKHWWGLPDNATKVYISLCLECI
jgi:hypothetical protein